jgi:hypothetical protein
VVPSVAGFVDRYLGVCPTPPAEGASACEQAALAFRKGAEGKPYSLLVGEPAPGQVQVAEVDARGGTAVFNLVPFFAGGASAITQGAPRGADAGGNPILPLLRIEGTIPEGWSPSMLTRQVQAQALRIEVVFTPQGLWSLPRRGRPALRGVKASLRSVRLIVGRTGEQLGAWSAP